MMAHSESTSYDAQIPIAVAYLESVQADEVKYRDTQPAKCGRTLLALRADLVTKPDETINRIIGTGLCGREALTIAKNANTLAIATGRAESDLSERQKASVNYPLYVIGGIVAATIFGGRAGGFTSTVVGATLDAISHRKLVKHPDVTAGLQFDRQWSPPPSPQDSV
jgi:hypothetical protein